MKHVNLKLLGTVVFLSATISSFSQNNWTINGNFNTTGGTNFLGTTNNQPLNFRTNNIQRMYINNSAFLNGGYIGIGPNFSAPQQLLHLHIARDAYAQFTNNTTGSGSGNGLLVGISDGPVTSSGHARLIQQSDYPMDFFTNNVQRFQLYNGNAATGGKAVFSNNLPLNYFPQERVTIYNNSADSAMLHFANNTTGANFSDGFKIGLAVNQDAWLYQWENRPIVFFTRGPNPTSNLNDQNVPKPRVMVTGGGMLPGGFDGLRVVNFSAAQTQASSTLDLWVQNSNQAWIKFDGGGHVATYNNRMNVFGLLDGVNINGTSSTDYAGNGHKAIVLFSLDTIEYARVGNPKIDSLRRKGFFRVGMQTQSALFQVDAQRRLTSHDNGMDDINNSQLRLSFKEFAYGVNNGGGGGAPPDRTFPANEDGNKGIYTDFRTTAAGNLYIKPIKDTTAGVGSYLPDSLRNGFVGIHTYTPGNTLEINSNNTSASPGNSGLRFTDLNVTSTAGAPTGKVLTVNAAGDVVLVRDSVNSQGTTLGNICNDSIQNPLTNNWEIPLNNHNFIFSNDSAQTGKVGIGEIASSCNPSNTLEIGALGNNQSGLTFTKLNSASPALANPSNKVLSVDSTGKVILVNDQLGSGGTGAFIGSQNGINNTVTALNPSGKVELGGNLLHATTINVGGNNFEVLYSGANISIGTNPNFYTSTSHVNNIGIGGFNTAASGANGNSAFGNYNNFFGTKGYAVGANNSVYGLENTSVGISNVINQNANPVYSNAMAVGFNNTVDATNTVIIGRRNIAQNITANCYAFGDMNLIRSGLQNSMAVGNFVVPNSSISIGNASSQVNRDNLAAYLVSNNPSTAHTDPAFINAHIIPAINISPANFIGIKRYAPSVALDVNGSIVTSGTVNGMSDSTLKTNIQPLNLNAVQKIKQFRPITFEWINKVDTGMYGTQYGFTAQQIETVMPDLVRTDSSGLKSLNQIGMIPLLVKAVQQQQSTIDSMRTMMTQMAEMLNSCCQNQSARTQTGTVINVELSDKDVIVLNQNVPNPFAEQTTITYNIPEKSGFAQIIFNDMKGQIIKVVDIKTKGKGQLNVFANDLSSGMYSYTLYVDGKAIDTKKMVKTE